MAKKQEADNSLQELRTSLREKRISNCYIFYGEEVFLLHHYFDQLKKMLVDDLTESFNFHKFSQENFDIQSLADAVESLPMMAEHTFVWVDDVDIFELTEDERRKLAELFLDIPEYCVLIFTYETVQWKLDSRFKKLAEAIKESAFIVQFPKQNQRDLIAWITRHFAANKKQIAPELCSYLIDLTGGTMTALAGEISKISAFSDSDVIVKNDIDAVTEPVMDAIVFQMTDRLAEGQYGAALLKLQQLLKMQEKPIAIAGAIGSHFRRLSAARILLDNGKNVNDFCALYGGSEYGARIAMNGAKKFSAAFCANAVELVMETDRQMKTSYDEPERLLEMLLLRLAEEARND